MDENKTLTFNWIPGNTGEYTIIAVVDSNYTINESNLMVRYYEVEVFTNTNFTNVTGWYLLWGEHHSGTPT
ncbi:CARDB domain-containing protein [Methanofervidicoccus abyssi]|uniref:CARDB domain-containing protein n=1 Tax=Methanofervidicoccus abyssi TaxID=2082189 RepID=UPI0018648747